MNTEIQDSIHLSTLKRIIKRIEKDYPNEDPELSFELIIGSCFPQAYKNVKEALTKAYIEGYNAGEKGES